MNAEDSENHFILADLMEKHTGQQLISNRHWRIEMALKPVMRKHSIPDIDVLTRLLMSETDPELTNDCVEAMINNETCFFRDQANFALVTGPTIDAMREKRMANRKLRIWSAACSSGQEAYSLAIAFAENAEKWRGWDIRIIATDISKSALEKAETGRYSHFEIQRGLPVTMMLKYFRQDGEEWVLNDRIRRMVQFSKHNLVNTAGHLGQLDIILCRNILMYLTEDNRRRVFENLSHCLKPDGYLMLGAAETVIGSTTKFVTSPDFRGLYELSTKREKMGMVA